MSREKQVEEMEFTEVDILANDINQHCADLAETYCGDTHCVACLANALYNAGYRKQSDNVIELPCKVGDTIYAVSNDFGGEWQVYECRIDNFTVYEKNTFMSISDRDGYNFRANICEIGKTAFLAREEAEQALAKMKGGEE